MAGSDGKSRNVGSQCTAGRPGRKRADRRNSGRGPGWRHEEIELAAYFNAERRGFKGNQALDDCLEAERYIAPDAADERQKE